MSATTTTNGSADDKQDYDAQFADLLGDLGNNSTVNGDISGVTTVTKTTEVNEDGDVVTRTTITTETDTLADGSQTQEPDLNDQAFPADAIEDEPSPPRASVSSVRTSTSSTRSVPQFEDTLADYQPPKRYNKKEETKDARGPNVYITQSGTPKPKDKTPSKPFRMLGAAENMCHKCNKRVYEMEKMIADKHIYHKTCFRCVHCNRVLSLGNFAAIDEKPYCKPHFIELFRKKGKYDMGKEATPRGAESTRSRHEADHVTADKESSVQAAPTPKRVNGTVEDDETDAKPQKEEPVRFQQMSSVRNMFETTIKQTSSSSPQTTPQSKRVSKWDKPAVNTPQRQQRSHSPELEPSHQDLEAEEEQDPPAAVTRNLVARFREIEQGDGYSAPDRKPVHKITPPRDELARGIEEARIQQHAHEESDLEVVKSGEDQGTEDELPPPQMTRNILAKFRSMEDVNQPPSPVVQRSASASSKKVSTPQQQQKVRQSSRASPDSGIMDVDVHPQVNGEKQRDDEEEPEKELPEQGFTRNLLAKWRVMEEDVTPQKASPAKTRKDSNKQVKTPSSAVPRRQGHSESPPRQSKQQYETEYQSDNGYDMQDGEGSPSEIIRASDTNEEDHLPPPSCTKNMLAKFQNLEAEAEKQAQQEPQIQGKKHFKWTVKEAPLISGSGVVWQEKRRGSSMEGDLHQDDQRYENDHYDDGEYDSRTSYKHDNRNNDQAFYENGEQIYDEPLDVQGIVHSDEPSNLEDELPPPAYTKNLLAKFRSFEDVSQPPPSPVRAERQQKVAYSSAGASGTRKFSSTSSLTQEVHTTHVYSDQDDEMLDNEHYDQKDQYDSQQHYDNDYYGEDVEGGEYENDPCRDPDLTRESDLPTEEELPEQGTTRHLLERFQSLTAH